MDKTFVTNINTAEKPRIVNEGMKYLWLSNYDRQNNVLGIIL